MDKGIYIYLYEYINIQILYYKYHKYGFKKFYVAFTPSFETELL